MSKYQFDLKKVLFGVLALFLVGATENANAQGYLEWYSSRGGSNFSIQGGLGSTVLIGDRDDPKLALGNAYQFNGGISYRLTNFISIRGEATIYQLYSENKKNVWDQLNTNPLDTKNLNVFGIDAYVALVHDLFPRSNLQQGGINAYGLVGVGTNYYVPKNGNNNDNLREENKYGFESEYAKLTPIVPIGGGIEYMISDQFSIGFEAIYKVTFTDLLDNIDPGLEVQLRTGSSSNNVESADDHYLTYGFKFKYSFASSGGSGSSISGFNYKSYLRKSRKRSKRK